MSTDEKSRILIIDDDQFIRKSYRYYLEDTEYEVLEAKNGIQGMEVFLESRPHVVLVDLRMPEMDGLEVLARVREVSPDTPVIVISGTGVIADVVEALHLGAFDYLIKPVEDLSVLHHTVRSALDHNRLVRENRAHQLHLEREVHRRTVELTRTNERLTREMEERRKTEEDMIKLLKAVEGSGEIVFMTDKEGVFTFINPEFTRIYGYQAEEIIGRETPRIIKSGQYDGRFYEEFWKAIINNEIIRGEIINQTRDGHELAIEGSVTPILNENEETVGFLAIQRDISERKKAERELRRANRSLRIRSLCNQVVIRAVGEGDMLNDICRVLNREGDYRFVWIGFFDRREMLGPRARFGECEGLLEALVNDSRGDEDEHRYLFHRDYFRRPMMIGDLVASSESETEKREAVRCNLNGRLSIPLIVEGRLEGALVVYAERVDAFDEGEITLLIEVVNDLAFGIQALREHQSRILASRQIQMQLDRIISLRTIDTAMTASSDLQYILDVIMKQAASILQIDAAAILLYDEGTDLLSFAAGLGFRTRALRHTSLSPGEGLAGRAAAGRTTVTVEDLSRIEPQFSRAPLMAAEQFVFYSAVPLLVNEKLKGVLEIFNRSPLDLDEQWKDYLESLANQAAIAVDKAELFFTLKCANAELSLSYDATLEGWARALELRDLETRGHSDRVVALTVNLAIRQGIIGEEIKHYQRGALLHDIGKLGIPDQVLLKRGPLNAEEWELMKKHPIYGYQMLKLIRFLEPARNIVLHHHEKWDGSGYPSGLGEREIPLEARMFTIVDVWDSLTNERCYRKAWSGEKTKAYMRAHSGSHFDPELLKVFMDMLENPR